MVESRTKRLIPSVVTEPTRRSRLMSSLIAAATLATCLGATISTTAQADIPTSGLWSTGFAPAGGLAFDRDGAAYICNYRRAGTIGRILVDGTASIWVDLNQDTEAGAEHQSLPAAISVDAEGRVIVADAGHGRLLRIDAPQNITTLAERYDGLSFESVTSLSLLAPQDSPPGAEIVFAASQRRTGEEPETSLYLLDLKTAVLTRLPLKVEEPVNITCTPDGKWLVVVESSKNRLWKLDWKRRDDAEFQAVSELGGDGSTLTKYPSGLCPGSQPGTIFIVAGHRHEVLELHLESGQTLRTLPLAGQFGVACAVYSQHLFVVIREKEAIFRIPLE
jgi:sugar lactone lactonase YvrE